MIKVVARNIHKKRLLLPFFLIMFLTFFILPYFSLEGYSILKHTTSQTVADFAGLWQRIMFTVSFAWLIFFLEGTRIRSAG